VTESEFRRIEKFLSEDHGGKTVCGGKLDITQRYISPTIIEDPKLDSKLMKEEVFGPLISVIGFSNIDEAINLVNSKEKALACYYFGKLNNPNKDRIISETSSGLVNVNDCTYTGLNANLPFGGVGDSGMGVLHGKWGFESCSHLKPVMEKTTIDSYPFNVRYPPYTPEKQAAFMEVMGKFGGLTNKKLKLAATGAAASFGLLSGLVFAWKR
jgi:aldehyde dehydrogenase (NAD+)